MGRKDNVLLGLVGGNEKERVPGESQCQQAGKSSRNKVQFFFSKEEKRFLHKK